MGNFAAIENEGIVLQDKRAVNRKTYMGKRIDLAVSDIPTCSKRLLRGSYANAVCRRSETRSDDETTKLPKSLSRYAGGYLSD